MSELKSRVMLAMLNVSVWSARAFDARATAEVQENHNPRDDIGRFNKRLLPAKAPSFEAVYEVARRAREAFYRRTLRYGQDGVRLLPASAYMELAAEIRGFKSRFPAAVDAFLVDLPSLKARQRDILNGLFVESDYPSHDELRKRFGFRFKVLPFPDAEQFGVELPQEALAQIRLDVEEHAAEVAETAMRDLWERLYEVVERMAQRLSQPKPVIRDSLVGNVKELVEILPSLNFAGDAKLSDLCNQVCAKLANQSPEDLRSNYSARAEAARQAADIQAQMAEYMGIGTPEAFGLPETEQIGPSGDFPRRAQREAALLL